ALGIAASLGLVRLVVSMAAELIPRSEDIAVDWTVVAFALAMAMLASLVSSAAPLSQAVRTAPTDVLNAGVRASAGVRVRALSQALVVAEVALAFTLLAVSAVLVVHLRALARRSPGFDPDNLVTFSLSLADTLASDDTARVGLQRRLTDALTAIPGVTDAAISNQVPLAGCCLGGAHYAARRTVKPPAAHRPHRLP